MRHSIYAPQFWSSGSIQDSLEHHHIFHFSPQNDIVQFSKAINRFPREDPTFRVGYDDESREVRFNIYHRFQVTRVTSKKNTDDIYCFRICIGNRMTSNAIWNK